MRASDERRIEQFYYRGSNTDRVWYTVRFANRALGALWIIVKRRGALLLLLFLRGGKMLSPGARRSGLYEGGNTFGMRARMREGEKRTRRRQERR